MPPFTSRLLGDPTSEKFAKRLRKTGVVFMVQGLIFLALLFITDLIMSYIFANGIFTYINIGIIIILAFYSLKIFSGLNFFIKSYFVKENKTLQNSREYREKTMEKYHKEIDYAGGRNHY